MHVSDSIVRWCGGLCLPLHGLQCAFYLHVVSLGRKLHTPLVCVCTFLQNEGLYNIMLYDRISIMDIDMDHLAGPNRQTPGKRERTSLPWPREGMHVGEFYTQTATMYMSGKQCSNANFLVILDTLVHYSLCLCTHSL